MQSASGHSAGDARAPPLHVSVPAPAWCTYRGFALCALRLQAVLARRRAWWSPSPPGAGWVVQPAAAGDLGTEQSLLPM